VKIVNGVGTKGLATRASNDLTKVGFAVTTLSVEPSGATNSVVQYAPGQLAAARTLAAAVPARRCTKTRRCWRATWLLVVGSHYSGAHAVRVAGSRAARLERLGEPVVVGTAVDQRRAKPCSL